MPSKSRLRAEKTLTDGRQLRIEWVRTIYPATRDEPQDLDDSQPKFFVDGQEVEYDDIESTIEDIDSIIDDLQDNGQVIDTYGDDYEC